MYKKKRVLALITARGGSKGLPGKNIRKLLGKPLIAWTIEQAQQSRFLDDVVVSTDDSKIASVVRKSGVREIIKRPKKFASDTASSIDVIDHAVKYLKAKGKLYDYIVLLEPTSPLRESKDIDTAIKELVGNKSGAVALVSVAKAEASHPDFIVRMGAKNRLSPFQKNSIQTKRRQDISQLYYFEGTVYVSEIRELLKRRKFYHEKTIGYKVPKWKSYEVDDLVDFISIEAILKNINLIKKIK